MKIEELCKKVVLAKLEAYIQSVLPGHATKISTLR